MSIDVAWIGIVLSIGMATFIHIVTAVWWASKINATLNFLQTSIHSLNDTILRHDANRYTTNDASKDFSIRDEQIKAAHRRIDEIKSSSNGNGK
jgi:hypothetical protein